MADPKYAGLPGIVTDQPDVYETSDLPESDQNLEFHDALDSTGDVEVLHISLNEAHSKFKDQHLDATYVDFSDRISAKTRTGYRSNRIEWALAGQGEEESLVERYNRLKCELEQLHSDIIDAKESNDAQPIEPKSKLEEGQSTKKDGAVVSAVSLERQAQSLHEQLLHLQLEKQLGAEFVEGIANPHLVTHQKLNSLIESIKHTKRRETEEVSAPNDSANVPNSLTYQLFCTPESSQLSGSGTVALEKRISRLESLMGQDQEKLSRIWSWTREGSILGAISYIGKRLTLLEPSTLAAVEGRLWALNNKMDVIKEKSGDLPQRDAKVAELSDVVNKCESLCSALPEMVQRLVALKGLHHQACQFGRTLQQLDVASTRIQASVSHNETLLSSVNDKFGTNLSVINENIAALDARIKALDKATK